MHLLLIRHGETDWNTEFRIQGHTDTPLNARGLAQAERLSERLAAEEPADVLYTSPLARACVTAEKIGQKLGLSPITDERLAEQNFGELEGLTFRDIEQGYPDFFRQWRETKRQLALPGGETIGEFQCRVQAFLNQVSEAHPDKSVVVVTHGGTLRVILVTLLGLEIDRRWPFAFDNTSLSKVEWSGSRVDVRSINDTCHLRNGHIE
jgi:broad specificity phosphatase PhoE